MQEFRCQCQGTDKKVQHRTMKKKCPALLVMQMGTVAKLMLSPLSVTTGPKQMVKQEETCLGHQGLVPVQVIQSSLSLRALDVKVRRGRPRINRYRPRIEMIKEKMVKKSWKK